MDFGEFLSLFTSNWPFAITVILTLAVVMVNGWTDAPNAIATCVSTRALSPRIAIVMAAIFNFFGVFVMTLLVPAVATTVFNMVDFGSDAAEAQVALCAAMFAIVTWATAAWYFGIPTSESHALIAAISGAAIAMHNGLGGINGGEWMKVIYGLLLSTVLGFGMGFGTTKLVEFLFRHANRRRITRHFRRAQVAGAAAMAFMHGAQDGQKFMGVFMLGMYISLGQTGVTEFEIPIWLMVLCSAVMALGTSIGGYRIIKAVGMDMVHLEQYQGFCADVAAAGCLLISSVVGMPVSTTHTKTTSIMGVGASKRLSCVNWSTVKDMVLTWVLTFPGCGLIGFLAAKIFTLVF